MANIDLPSQAGLSNASSADQAIAAATLAYITGSNLAVLNGGLKVNASFRWTVTLTKTAAGTAARSFHLRIGTAGSTADAAVATFTTGVGTAAIDTAVLDLSVTIRGPITAACVAVGVSFLSHELATTGFLTKGADIKSVVSNAFDATVANLIVGLSVQAGASEVLTIKQVLAEAWGM